MFFWLRRRPRKLQGSRALPPLLRALLLLCRSALPPLLRPLLLLRRSSLLLRQHA